MEKNIDNELKKLKSITSLIQYLKHMKENNLEKSLGQWHRDRNLIDGSTDKDQFMKLLQEVGELSDSLCKGKDFRDDR